MVVRVPHVLFVSTVAACSGPRTELVFDRTIPLPGARFAGPITVDVPRRDAFGGRDLEYVVELEARCTPALQIGYPDGEVRTVGSKDGFWQQLLGARAAAGTKAEEPPPAEPAPASAEPAPVEPVPAGPGAVASAPPGAPAPIYVGRWQQVTTETWPGQMRFLAERDRRCTSSDRWSRRYLTGLDETGQITVWADTPQELDGARLTVRVYAVGDIVAPPKPVTASVAVKAEVKTQVRVRPPEPPPKNERPGRSKDPGGVWRPGHWQWREGNGRWVWVSGDWGPPSTTPAPKTENRGAEPAPGARWKSGYWAWVVNDGSWTWVPGEWLAPPPIVENPGTPQVPEQEWISGSWIKTGVTFTWKAGFWGRPRQRVETPPPAPSTGARWIAGVWMRKNDQWIWSPGYYERVGRPPPALRAETPSAKPEPEAVWLAGFWRWDDARSDYTWVPGYWERPPGAGYVWVWDEIQPVVATPSAPSAPVIRRSGRWILKVNVDVNLRGGRR